MAAPVGLLLVHGIGTQRRGDTLDGFLGGMRLAYGERLVVERGNAAQAILSGLGRNVHVFEVYWADLLHGEDVKGTFDANRIHETVWFPLLNHTNGRLPPRAYPRIKVLAYTWSLAVLGVLVSSGLMGAKMLASAGSGAVRPWRERQARGTRPVKLRESWRRVWRATSAVRSAPACSPDRRMSSSIGGWWCSTFNSSKKNCVRSRCT